MTQADNRIPNHFAIVACADHVARGVAGGFMQVNHGKLPPLRRIRPGDTVVAYSPTKAFGVADDLKSFSAFGVVLPGEPYQFDMGGGFKPFRRDVHWAPTRPASIRPLLDRLDLTRGVASWGYQFRFGVISLSEADARLIGEAMALPADWLAQAA